ncbi:membrane assembly protein AsmA [Vibrio sinaloensis]|uniref:AsmA family protein n=1 Tax=Photobacterium sp. (strain ATCC 43367) TaxID=379097 RepID=UPI00057EE99D|nr:AsmA family protein [Vibrio sinaloensis]KIE19526.1 membrane assembly protein AsmA [Vibrio sinaloensis]
MKKPLILTTIILISLICLSLLSLFAILQTRHAPQVVSYLFEQLTPYRVNTQQVTYTPPLQLSLQDVVVEREQQQARIPKLTVWLSQSFWQNGKLAFDSLLIEGATLDLSHNYASMLDGITLRQVALQHVDLTSDQWSAREVNLQVENPEWKQNNQALPFGDIQFSAKQLYVRGEALNDVLVDAQYKPQNSTLYGASFKWHGAEFSGQAEQFQQGWSLINVTIFDLNLDSVAPATKLINTLNSLEFPVYHINSLDILRSNVNYQGWHFEQLDASIENLYLNQSLWQQENGYFSFDAELLTHQELRFINPTAELGFGKNDINVELFNADFKQGWLQFKGKLSQERIALDELRVSGVKWLEDLPQMSSELKALASSLSSLTIKELDVRNSQLIQVEKRPYWQVSGLSIEGRDLEFINPQQTGLLNGKIELSASNASLDNLLSTQLVVEMQAEQGKLNLERAFFPLQAGYIEANGQWDRSSISAPWRLTLHADGVPADLPLFDAQLPFYLQGMAEVELELSGLSGDYSMFAHSLSGDAKLQLHQTTLKAKSADGETSFEQEWPLETISIQADRGRLSLSSKGEEAELTGHIDMLKPEFATLLFRTQTPCQRLWSDIFSLTNVIEQTCQEAEATPPAHADGAQHQEEASDSSGKIAL